MLVIETSSLQVERYTERGSASAPMTASSSRSRALISWATSSSGRYSENFRLSAPSSLTHASKLAVSILPLSASTRRRGPHELRDTGDERARELSTPAVIAPRHTTSPSYDPTDS